MADLDEGEHRQRDGHRTDSFEYTPFAEHGGIGKAAQVFGDRLTPLMDELTEVLAA